VSLRLHCSTLLAAAIRSAVLFVWAFCPGDRYIPTMMPNLSTIAETIERARADALAGREQVTILDAWSAVRRMLTDHERRPAPRRRPGREVARRLQGRHRSSWANK
jgi:hypothetical protein